MTRIGLISDTHSYMDDRILEHLKGVDEIWHAGDLGDISITDTLETIAPVKAVFGNIDGAEIRRVWPLNRRGRIEGLDVWMTHIGGKPYSYTKETRDEMRTNPPDIFICGHSHILRVEKDKRANCLYINPGAAGRYGIHKIRTLLRFTLDAGNIKDLEVVELGPRADPSTTD